MYNSSHLLIILFQRMMRTYIIAGKWEYKANSGKLIYENDYRKKYPLWNDINIEFLFVKLACDNLFTTSIHFVIRCVRPCVLIGLAEP